MALELRICFVFNGYCYSFMLELLTWFDHFLKLFMLLNSGGYYYGKIKFPPEYPFKPPGIRFANSCRFFSINWYDAFTVIPVLILCISGQLVLIIIFFSVLICSMTTPNGRFMTQKKICLSMSDCMLLSILFTTF